jgi:hypothetical protein
MSIMAFWRNLSPIFRILFLSTTLPRLSHVDDIRATLSAKRHKPCGIVSYIGDHVAIVVLDISMALSFLA